MKKFKGIVQHDNGDKEVHFFVSDACTPEIAMQEYNDSRFSSNWIKPIMLECSHRHGGLRSNAGCKGSYAESTKAHKIPCTMAKYFKDFTTAIADIIDILDEYEELANLSPTSPRFDKLNKVLEQTRESRNLVRKVVNAFRRI